MKALEELNQKVYYRFIKVIFVLTFLTVLSFLIFNIYKNNRPRIIIDNSSSYIFCENGKKINAADKDVLFVSEKFPEIVNKQIKTLCLYDNGWINLDSDYKINFAYKNVGGWNLVAFLILIELIGLIIIFEVIKRLFYYIILGKFDPSGFFKKKDITLKEKQEDIIIKKVKEEKENISWSKENPLTTKSFILTFLSSILFIFTPPIFGIVAMVISSRFLVKAKKQNEDKKLRKIANIVIFIPVLLWIANSIIWSLETIQRLQ